MTRSSVRGVFAGDNSAATRKDRELPYTADDVVMVGKMSLACLAAVDFGRVEVDVICQPHAVNGAATALRISEACKNLDWSMLFG